ncbi:MAG: solute carrier family 26 protein [Bacteroidia bacterium]|nr:solute carrier family 26 protein [Bacteroidia bacterium]NNK70342.1 solute carrier family 26 protein [Flavobacteriaceae bacterium]NNL80890.1 solute carrier family 26 protein [Flavobacteriaceae bacterium]
MLKAFFPIIDWIKAYQKPWLKGDLSAGLTVGVMLIPQGMAYASIAGLPAVYGLYASVIPILLYAIFGSSRQLAVGPVAMVSLLTATALGAMGGLSMEQYIAYAVLLAFMVGGIQFLLGLFRLGFLVNFLSHPVVSGFTSAAALIIGFSQLKHLLGIEIPRSHHVHEIILHAVENLDQLNYGALFIGLLGIGVIVLSKRINKSLPGALFAVIIGILIISLTGWGEGEKVVPIVGDIPSTLPSFVVPDLSLDIMQTLLPMALTIALISFMESIAVAKAVQIKHRDYEVSPNQELIALGLANIGGSFFQSYPTTGGFSRTAVNDQAGAKTGLAGIVSAVLIVLTLIFLTPLFYNLPKAILASVIMVAVFGLINYKEAIHLYKSHRTDFWMLIVTFLATLSLGIEIGIGVGVILSLAMVLFKTTRPHTARLAKVPDTHFYRNIERFDDLEVKEEVLIYRFDAQLFFANITFFKDKLYEYEALKNDKLKLLIIDGESINNIDSTAIHALEEIVDDFKERGVEVCFTGIKGPVRDVMMRSGFTRKVHPDHFFMSIQEAIDHYFDEPEEPDNDTEFSDYINQANL